MGTSSKHIVCAVANTPSLPGQVSHNLNIIERAAKIAADAGAELLLTPELSASGYGGYEEVLATAEVPGGGPIFDRLAGMAQTLGLVIGAGLVEKSDRCYLTHLFVHPDGTWIQQRKFRVTPLEQPLAPARPLNDEGFPQAYEIKTFKIKDILCATTICADFGLPGVFEHLESCGVELLMCPSGAGGTRADLLQLPALQTPAGRQTFTDKLESLFFPGNRLLAEQCILHRRGLLEVNLVGFDGKDLCHGGHGMIINPLGEVVGFIPGQPVIERQRLAVCAAEVDFSENIDRPQEFPHPLISSAYISGRESASS